jgi:hypothetical protein
VLDTLASPNPDPIFRSGVPEKCLDHGRLANPWLARDEHNLSLSLKCLIEAAL